MGRQTNLEKKAIDRRQVELVRSDYNKTEKYDESHEDAKSDASRVDKPLGKGTAHGGHTHYRPDYTKSQTLIAKFEEFFSTSYKDDVFEILEK